MMQGIGPDMIACKGLSLSKSEKLRDVSLSRSGPICSCTTYYDAKLNSLCKSCCYRNFNNTCKER